jgi:hypothetical protein
MGRENGEMARLTVGENGKLVPYDASSGRFFVEASDPLVAFVKEFGKAGPDDWIWGGGGIAELAPGIRWAPSDQAPGD